MVRNEGQEAHSGIVLGPWRQSLCGPPERRSQWRLAAVLCLCHTEYQLTRSLVTQQGICAKRPYTLIGFLRYGLSQTYYLGAQCVSILRVLSGLR